MALVDASAEIVDWAKWAVGHQPWFEYDEERPFSLYLPTATHHIADDCSTTVDLYFWLAGCPDPMGNGYNRYGNSDTLAARGTPVELSALKPADVVVYWPMGDSTCYGPSQHTALIVEPGADPLTVSHGQPSEPAFVSVSHDGRPHRFFRFNTSAPAPAPKETPVDDQFLTANPNGPGDFLCSWSTRIAVGVPNATVEGVLVKQGCKRFNISAETFAYFEPHETWAQ